VITSTASSLPEVAGPDDAARLVNPADTAALAEAMRQVMADLDLQAAMSQQGLARAAEFRWDKTARETVEVYRKAMAKSGN
jgi:glycosyltransferase involved in cell wall biosynthesis